ncbi:WSC domain protein [Ceratobasidium sp. AG-Ba]|nr:WSC domain protein [Ceratobasidium sp. AG-Ba]
MAPSLTSLGAGALVVTSLLSGLASADLLQPNPAHRIARHSRLRRALPTGWEARGCFTDAEAPNRALQISHTDEGLTTASCIKSCSASGYSVAGTQFGKECWCGKSVSTKGGAGASATSGCDMPCAGDPSQLCGGNYKLNLYAKSTKDATTTTSAYGSPTPSAGGKTYTLKEQFSGKNFFNNWWFYNYTDPTNGQVDYLTKEEATAANLAYVQDDGIAVMKVDNTSKLGPGEPRKSVRIQSNKQYNKGLIVADILQMPFGCSVCSIRSQIRECLHDLDAAYWTVGDHWPNNGEIDILENVNLAKANQYTLHTGPNSTCTIDTAPAAKFKVSSNVMGKTCASKEGANAGCGYSDPSPTSYGQSFNEAGGAVIAMEWQNEGIRIWKFDRGSIPSDLQGNGAKPNPDNWNTPVAAWPASTCNISNEVKNHNIIFDITLCGGWAGDDYKNSGCPGTCPDRIMDPSNFNDAVWKIKSVQVYQ